MLEKLSLVDHSDDAAMEAFRLLLEDPHPLAMPRIAGRLGVSAEAVSLVFDKLVASGRAEVAGGNVVGVYGLSLNPAVHSITIDKARYYVWCAFDAVGIPAALGESASIAGKCGRCDREIKFEMLDGRVPDLPVVVSWPSSDCASVRADFCPKVLFFCNREEHDDSLEGQEAPGGCLTLVEAEMLGRKNWGWARSR